MVGRPTPAGPPPPGKPLGRNLPTAIAVGVTLAGAFLGTLLADPLSFMVFIGAMVVLGLLELDKAFRRRGWRPATPVAAGAGLICVVGAYTSGPSGQAVGLVVAVLGSLVWALFDRHRTTVVAGVGATLLMTLWVPFLSSFIGLLLARPNGEWFVMATVALTVTSDIAAFAFGNRFGRRRLAPSISPAKTWEGFAGSLVTVVALAGLGTARVPGFDATSALLLGVVVCLAATAGDLAESMVKRDLGVKDFGGILPGHGGIMDRADAVIFALPAGHLLLSALGK
ncbi:MAG: phosphatidate cytidylyltransferase [Euzebyales bacterium]|nr:phosphatidate cytidylyltransferase [Euzebyales bacterium]